MSQFEFVVLRQLPCLQSVVDVLATDRVGLATLSALAQTCRCAAARLRAEQSIYRAAFILRFGRLWSERTPWRTALRTAMLSMSLRPDDDAMEGEATSVSNVEYNYNGDESLLADRVLQSSFWHHICTEADLRAAWAVQCLPLMTTFFGGNPIHVRHPLWLALLSVAGLFGAQAVGHTASRPDLLRYLVSFTGFRSMVFDPLGPGPALDCDASLCVFSLLTRLCVDNSSQSGLVCSSLVNMRLWPARNLVPSSMQEFATEIDLDAAAALLNSHFVAFSGKYLYGEEHETDPPMLGRLDFAPFVSAQFTRQIEGNASRIESVLHTFLEFAADIDERRALMFTGTCDDAQGASQWCGFLETDSLKVTMVKSYAPSAETLTWIYRGRLFPFGIGGRWSRNGLPTNWSGPFLLVPGAEAARTYMSIANAQ
jgi:hypothetical protein